MHHPLPFSQVHGHSSLYDWHHLISGDPESVHRAGVSVRGRTISELDVSEEDWDRYVIGDLS